jgi:hypothetical protein
MGLTIHYTCSVKDDLSSGPIYQMAQRTADYARKIGCAKVSPLIPAKEHPEDAPLFFRVGKAKDGTFGAVRPWRGWLVDVWPGAGCETATLGLCQYPEWTTLDGKRVPTGCGRGWRFHSFCKTQYAGEHGWDNFLKCHLLVISLLDFWRSMGVRVKVNDEGGYWKTRSIEKLREELAQYDSLLAAAGGIFKDAEGGLTVKSPIFDYKNFERLEHEGWQKFGGRLQQLRGSLSKNAR